MPRLLGRNRALHGGRGIRWFTNSAPFLRWRTPVPPGGITPREFGRNVILTTTQIVRTSQSRAAIKSTQSAHHHLLYPHQHWGNRLPFSDPPIAFALLSVTRASRSFSLAEGPFAPPRDQHVLSAASATRSKKPAQSRRRPRKHRRRLSLAIAGDFPWRGNPAFYMRNLDLNCSGNPAPAPIFDSAFRRKKSDCAIESPVDLSAWRNCAGSIACR